MAAKKPKMNPAHLRAVVVSNMDDRLFGIIFPERQRESTRLHLMRRPRRLLRAVLNLRPLPKLSHVGPQLPVALGLTGLDKRGQRMLVNDVEPNKVVRYEPPVQVSHVAVKQPRMLPATPRLRFHSF